MNKAGLTPDVLSLDCASEVTRIGQHMIDSLKRFHKRGVVLG